MTAALAPRDVHFGAGTFNDTCSSLFGEAGPTPLRSSIHSSRAGARSEPTRSESHNNLTTTSAGDAPIGAEKGLLGFRARATSGRKPQVRSTWMSEVRR